MSRPQSRTNLRPWSCTQIEVLETNMSLLRGFAIVACLAGMLTSGVCQQPTGKPKRVVPAVERVQSRFTADSLADFSESLQHLASKVSSATVQIEVSGFGLAEDGERKNATLIVRQHAIGSGVILDPDGYIMTNAHVIEGAQRIRVVITTDSAGPNGLTHAVRTQILDAKVIGIQKEADLALVKVEGANLPTLQLKLDGDPKPGELVFAVGSPEGLQNSITMGIISAVFRQPDPDNPMVYLQTDAPINPGNSGGPLVDVTGAVVGLNTFIFSKGGGNEGLGFAVPAPIVNFVYKSLRTHGHVDHVEIGVVAQTITPTLAKGLGLSQDWGVVIADVLPHGAASVAGLEPADVVVAVDGHPMLGLHAFTAALYQHPPDRVVNIEILRGAEHLSFSVPAILARDRMDQFAGIADPKKSHIAALAVLALNLNDELRSMLPGLRSSEGVLVLGRAAGFSSANSGLQSGDVIESLNHTSIASVEQLKAALARLKSGDSVVLRIERLGQLQYLAFELD